jgi:hypothetical protein
MAAVAVMLESTLQCLSTFAKKHRSDAEGLVHIIIPSCLVSYINLDVFLELFQLSVLRLGTFDEACFQRYPVKISKGFIIVKLTFTTSVSADLCILLLKI